MGSLDVQSVPDWVVMSVNLTFERFWNVPTAANATVVGVGAPLGTLVVVPVGPGVSVGLTFGVLVGVGLTVRLGLTVGVIVAVAVAVAVKVGVGGGPFDSVIASSAKPGPAVGAGAPPLLPPQLSITAPLTNNRTGATTSHLSHRDNIK
ncbi:MAG TPA: hypothetical protein VGR40_10460 [Candidatus Binatus sp.]|nr:hypothetical protein [Candidatus Binatus sp.]